tara:strand:- start:452 stop:1951 length:1500 start_codon:yes stop_codon:yes gene_type:complete
MIKLPCEVEEGNIEYKRDLLKIDNERKIHMSSQMKWRIAEGNGKAYYYIGINDDGSFYGLKYKELNLSIKILKEITKIINVKIVNINKIKIECKFYAIIIIENNLKQKNIKIAFLGGTQCGKTTTINILMNGIKDDGKGLARLSLFNHKHEVLNGKTSSIATQILGYKNNICINSSCISNNDIIRNSDKIVNLIDYPGSLKYSKTIFSKLLSMYPETIIITINPFKTNFDILKFYLKYCKINNIYFLVLFTNNDKKKFLKKIINIINFFKNNKIKLNNYEKLNKKIDIQSYYYLSISNINKHNYLILYEYINKVSNIEFNFDKSLNKNNNEIQIIQKYSNYELGTIFSGYSLNGKFNKNDIAFIRNNNEWNKIQIKSLHMNQNEYTAIEKNNILGIMFDILDNNIILDKPTLIVDKVDTYTYINKINFKIVFKSYKKLNLKKGIEIIIFIRNNIMISKLLDFNDDDLIVELSKNIIINKEDTLIFKINKIYGLGSINKI